jgi:ABC-type bacteriocin/lantibiotic exporter with double-glycine peptidase domain
MTGEVDDLGGFAAEALNTPIIEGGTLISLFGFALFAEPRLAAIGAAALALQTLVTPVLQGRINLLTRKRIKALRRSGLDLVDATLPIHAPGRLTAALGEIRHTYRVMLRMNGLKAATKVLNNMIMHAARIAILGYGGWLVVQGEIGIGLVVAFLSGLAQIDDHWGELLDFYRRWTNARVKFRLVAEIMTERRPAIATAP